MSDEINKLFSFSNEHNVCAVLGLIFAAESKPYMLLNLRLPNITMKSHMD